jgi:hypothetical protein
MASPDQARVVESMHREPVMDEWFGTVADTRPLHRIEVKQRGETVFVADLHPTIIPIETVELPNPLYLVSRALARRVARKEAQRLNSNS